MQKRIFTAFHSSGTLQLKEIHMKKLAWLLGAVALVGLTACDEELGGVANNCGAVNCTADAPLCVLADFTNKGQDICLTEDKKVAYDMCGHAEAPQQGSQWIDVESGVCVTRAVGQCETHNDCEEGMVCNTETHVCEVSTAPAKPRLVRIDDLTEVSAEDLKKNGDDPGADIDTVILTKADKTVVYVKEVKAYHRADGQSAKDENDYSIAVNPQAVVGKPTSFIGYPNDKTNCYYYKEGTNPNEKAVRPFVSLGGVGGYIEVIMGDDIEAGDTISVLELGGCTLQNTKDGGKDQIAMKEAVKVQISISGNEGDWAVVGNSSDAVKDKGYTGIYSIQITDQMVGSAK